MFKRPVSYSVGLILAFAGLEVLRFLSPNYFRPIVRIVRKNGATHVLAGGRPPGHSVVRIVSEDSTPALPQSGVAVV
jgi:hypothetical protein